MATFDVDAVTPEAVFSGFKNMGSNFAPGGKEYTLANARRWALSNFIEVGFDHEEMPSFGENMIVFRTGSDTVFSRSRLLTLMDAQLSFEGRTYMLESIEPYKEEHYYDYDSNPYWVAGLELTFTVKG